MNEPLHQRAKSVFLRAVELPQTARQAFVERHCGEDAELRAEVESLLAHHHAETLIASPPTTARLDASRLNSGTSWAMALRVARLRAALIRLRPQGHVALGALVATLMLAAVGWWVHAGTETTLRRILRDKLQGLLDADAEAVDLWIEREQTRIQGWAADQDLRDAAAELLRIDSHQPDARRLLLAAPQGAAVASRLQELAGADVDYLLWDRTQTIIADSAPDAPALANSATPTGGRLLSYAFGGETILCVERPADPLIRLAENSPNVPRLAIISPLISAEDRIVGALMIRDIDRDGELGRILGHVKTGETGECYAFDRQGVLLTESRFDETLEKIGLISPGARPQSATVVSLRDPGGDLTAGYRPKRPLAACPLTEMAAHAVAGEDGIDLDGYRDFRGVEVIGAWKWLAKYSFGMAIEIECREAYEPLRYLDAAFGAILGLLALSMAAIAGSWFFIARLRREVSAARQLGQYTLEELIGEGGMGQVYRARHSLLKRPTAIKVLKPDHSTPGMLARFEQEVQLSSQLTHPNTIEIYDYGRTADDVFYYAMEYVDGLNLSQVVAHSGPLPPARVVHILRQVCSSLREAHGLGLVHRDIKPQNIMLCCRAGEADVVKVLDFGLVKQITPVETSGVTSQTVLAGTPLYMSPERLLDPQAVDGRADIYSVGAVAFKLLTGEDVFVADSAAALLTQILETPPPQPAERAACPIPQELDALVVACLAKRADERPASAADVLKSFDAMPSAAPWTQRQAFQWWQVNDELRGNRPSPLTPAAT